LKSFIPKIWKTFAIKFTIICKL